MLAYRRPAGSTTEAAFCQRWLSPLGATEDAIGNWHLTIGASRVLWSAHLDTVHSFAGNSRIRFDGRYARAHKSVLGADDTAGCFLLCELARRHVPGIYIWHAGEEIGCLGSRDIVDSAPDWLDDLDMVIALDRRGTHEIITHQMCRRTCSEAFAADLAAQLTSAGLPYRPSANGLYTDSDSYAPVVPECTNLSVGYDHEHSDREVLDVPHVLRLLDALSVLNVSALSVARDPLEADDDDWGLSWRVDSVRLPSGQQYDWANWPADDDDPTLAVDVAAVQRRRKRSCWLTEEVADVQDALMPRDYGSVQ